MFPWTYGFHWNAASLIFLGAFYTVLAIVLTTVIAAFNRSRRAKAAGLVEELRWHSGFEELPARDRICRHVFTGEFAYRECPNAFDCRRCLTHQRLLAAGLPAPPKELEEEVLGMAFPRDRYYHRGHTWFRPEPDGTATIGLDEFGRRLLGVPDAIELPGPGERLRVSGTAWRIQKRGSNLRMLSPVDGEVVETGGPDRDWYLRVKPWGGKFDLRHLLAPCEVRPWMLREIERLQLVFSAEGAPALADGGVPVEDIAANAGGADSDSILAEMFLEQ